jgi:hypothetical protein
MDKKAISTSHKMKGLLDDDGTILHEFDKHTYQGGQNLKESLTVADISADVIQRLLEAASDENKELVRKRLNLDS